MAEEIVKTIEGVDKLFSQIVVNGEVHKSQRYVSPSNAVQQTSQTSNNRSTVGEDLYGAELNGILHNFVDRAVTQGLADEATARQLADNILQTTLETIQNLIPTSATPANKLVDSASVNSAISSEVSNRNTAISNAISTEVTNRNTAISNAINALDVASAGGNGKYIKAISETDGRISATEGTIDSAVSSSSDNPVSSSAVSSAITPVQASISDIEALIPNQTSAQNQLADKDFVNSSIATNTANFLGTYTSLADIQAIQNPTNNDYAYFQTTDSAGNTQFQRYKYSSSDNQWHYEYTLNNSSFTAEQWATINSGLTSTSISDAISTEVTNRNTAISDAISTEVTNRNTAISDAKYEVSIGADNNPDNYPNDAVRIYIVKNYNIGWVSNDGFIINIPWDSTGQFGFQIAFDDQSNWAAVRSESGGVWTAWNKVIISADIANTVASGDGNPVSSSAVYSHVDTVVTQAIAQVLNTSY